MQDLTDGTRYSEQLFFHEPMKTLRVRDLPSGDWLYELKFDGYRALAFKVGKEVRLISRIPGACGPGEKHAFRQCKNISLLLRC
jgi:hypothetical protein